MLVDTHCHINMMVKKDFDRQLTTQEITQAKTILDDARAHDVTRIINVGTSLIESKNCIALARAYEHAYATIGIHPNDLTSSWRTDLQELETLLENKKNNKILGIGEIGLDRHYPDYNLPRQKDAFKAQIELALENDLAIVVHTRDAADETLTSLEEFKNDIARGIIHCFSEDKSFADTALSFGFSLGIGGTLTYPRNKELRTVFSTVDLHHVVLETDAPFLPPQTMRGTQNHPRNIKVVAEYLAELRNDTLDNIATATTRAAHRIFGFPL